MGSRARMLVKLCEQECSKFDSIGDQSLPSKTVISTSANEIFSAEHNQDVSNSFSNIDTACSSQPSIVTENVISSLNKVDPSPILLENNENDSEDETKDFSPDDSGDEYKPEKSVQPNRINSRHLAHLRALHAQLHRLVHLDDLSYLDHLELEITKKNDDIVPITVCENVDFAFPYIPDISSDSDNEDDYNHSGLHVQAGSLCWKTLRYNKHYTDSGCYVTLLTLVPKRTVLYTDNWYTSIDLAEKLLLEEMHLVGTLRKNRKKLPKDVMNAKLKPGEYSAAENDKGIIVMKWRDKRDVSLLSTKHTTKFVTTTNKRGQSKRKPQIVVDYNKAKSAVDLSDQMTAYSSPLRKTVKWYRKLACELLLNTAMVNAMVLYKQTTKKNISVVQFLLKVAYITDALEDSDLDIFSDDDDGKQSEESPPVRESSLSDSDSGSPSEFESKSRPSSEISTS
ncbi:unnamed protein product [Parnassius apollo]|uniref:(apollo) hypothetical protein n=1 Tax=Parnassius apollo TaxID=110799 RepID=A0A8S3WHK8_PARAO|nr:unnamed protein product [Parnassius apollo]